MNTYVPSLDQVEELAAAHPDRFSSVLQTQRSIANARKNDIFVQEVTARNQYQDYLKNGGTPIGPNGQMPPKTDVLDQQFGSASCNCGAATPCCLTGLKFTCSHGSERMVLPLKDPEKRAILALVTDQAGPPTLHDKITITPIMQPQGNCRMSQKQPVLRITGAYAGDMQLGKAVSWPVDYHDKSHLGSNALTRYFTVMKYSLYDEIDKLAKFLDLEVLSCARRSELNAAVHVYPKLEWACSAFAVEIKGTFLSNFTFQSSIGIEGSVEGTFHDNTFKVGGEASSTEKSSSHSKSMIPFLDSVLGGMKSLTGQTAGNDTKEATRSKIVVTHKYSMGESKLKLVENPTDHSKIGIEANIKIGYAPLLGITAFIDVIDIILAAAEKYPPSAGLARVLRKARDAAAKGIGDEKSAVQASAHAALTLSADSQVGGGATITRQAGDDIWQSSGKVEGKIKFELAGVARGEGRIYMVEGSFAAEGKALTDITATLNTLTAQESKAANGAKFKTKIEWGGIKIKYKAVGKASISVFSGSVDSAGELVVQEKATWYEKTS